jgi:hypothetical protein
MKKDENNPEKIDDLIKGLNELREIVLQIHSKIQPDSSEAEVLREQLKAKEWEIMQHVMRSELRLTTKEIEECLTIIKLIKKSRVQRKDLVKLNATFDDFNCTATIGGIKFHCHFMLIDEFYVLQGS